jgi:alanine dehydrogenase
MFKVRALNQGVLKEILDMKTVIEKVEEAYLLKEKFQAELFPMIFHEFEPGVADMDIKSGHINGVDIFGLKLVSWFGNNSEKNLPPLVGTVMVYDAVTGVPKGILTAEHITNMRTGAAGAIGAKYLARKSSKNLLIVGTGHQAPYQIAATLMVMPNIKNVYLYNPRSFKRAKTFTAGISKRLKDEFLEPYLNDQKLYECYKERFDVNFEAVESIAETTKKADIIITVTPSRETIIKKEWVQPGTHFSCIGSDMSGKKEIDENILINSLLFTDDIIQSMNVGEAETAIKGQLIHKEDYKGEIGAVILDFAKGREQESDITVFDSTGIALQDLMTANYALEVAKEKNIGDIFSL